MESATRHQEVVLTVNNVGAPEYFGLMGVAHVPLQGAAAEKAVPFPIDMLDAAGELREHLARVEDYILAEVVWRGAIARWPGATIICGRVGENAPARCEKKVGGAAFREQKPHAQDEAQD